MANDTGLPAKTDHLKYYCIVFGLLVLIIAGVAIHQKGKLDDYRKANAFADRLLTGQGLPAKTYDNRPNRVQELAIEVERLVQGYTQSVGDEEGGGAEAGISVAKMKKVSFLVSMQQTYAGPERDDPNNSKGHKTIYREFTYAPATLEQLAKLIFNIEQLGRYRVFELRWNLMDPKANSEPPFHRIAKSVIKVGFRKPYKRR